MSVNAILIGQGTSRYPNQPITKAAYDQLSAADKAKDIVYVITDENQGEGVIDTPSLIITKEEYDALSPSAKQANILYNVVDETGGPETYTKNQVNTLLDEKADQTDLTTIHQASPTCTETNGIAAGMFFYLDNELVVAKTAIANGATFTLNTNYEPPTAGGLNALKSATLRFPDYANPEVVTPTTSSQTFSKDGIVVVGSNVLFSSLSNADYYAAVIGNAFFYINFYEYELNVRREQIALPVKKGTTYRYEISGGTLGRNEWMFIPFIT